MKGLLVFLILFFSVSTSEARSLAKIQKRSIVIGVIDGNAPLGKDHRGKGVEFELIVAIAQEIGVPFNLVPVESVREGETLLKDDKIDALIAGYRSNSRSNEQFLQSTPYYKSGLAILVPASDNSTYVVKDLEGKSVATTAGSDARDFFKNYLPTCKVDVVSQILAAQAMLKAHEVSAIADDKVFLDYIASVDKTVRVLDATLSETSYVILFNKSFSDVRDEVNRILAKLRTAPSSTAPSFLRSLLAKYELDMPIDEIIGPNLVQPSQAQAAPQAAQGKPTTGMPPSQRLEKLEAQLIEMQKEIRELRKLLKK